MDIATVIVASLTLVFLLFSLAILQLRLFVEKTSRALNGLTTLNKEYSSKLGPIYCNRYDIVVRYKRLEQYEDRSLEYSFGQYVAEHIDSFLNIYHSIQLYNQLHETYYEEYAKIEQSLGASWNTTFPLSQKRYNDLERRLFKKSYIQPAQTKFHVTKSYTSRKKQRHYECSKVFYADDFIHECDKTIEKARNRKSANVERKKMTPDLRYRVFNRDGFHCVLCGRSASDGVILHVDHIIPVSRGGATTLDNLRTLCADCNLGKGDKLETPIKAAVSPMPSQ